ncbi:hypothetical protein C8J56DRAFT_1061298 [Mycena floridula]|nr:hypothetical protein C8J56DRAFT_1061298 [Mycena floridula]
MASLSSNLLPISDVASGSVNSYNERYSEVRAILAGEMWSFVRLKPNPFWPLKEMNYWLSTWNGFMTAYLLCPILPTEPILEDEEEEEEDDRRIRASLDSMSCAFDSWRNCCFKTLDGLPSSWTKIDSRCDDIIQRGFPVVATSSEDVRRQYAFSYAKLEMLHAPYTKRVIALFDELRLRLRCPHVPFFTDAPSFDPTGPRPINGFHVGMRPIRVS